MDLRTWFFLIGAVVGDLVGGGDWRPVKNRKPEVAKVLATQQAAWNRGDLDGFMASYWKSEHLAFCSGAEMTFGWKATYDRFAKKYKGEGNEMGKLSFEEVEVLDANDKAASARKVPSPIPRRQDVVGPIHARSSTHQRRLEDRSRPHVGGRETEHLTCSRIGLPSFVPIRRCFITEPRFATPTATAGSSS